MQISAPRARPGPPAACQGSACLGTHCSATWCRNTTSRGCFAPAPSPWTAEHGSRLVAMQAAEKNLDERLEEMTGRYRRERQSLITAELLELVSGYAAES